MWSFLRKLPSILVGQCIFSYLSLKDLVRLESALASSEQIQTLCSFLSYLSKPDVKVDIPMEISKLKWIQAHGFLISKAIVRLDMIKSTFETTMIDEIELEAIYYKTTGNPLNYLPHSCYEKVVSVYIDRPQDPNFIEELLSLLYNLRSLKVYRNGDGWMHSVLQKLQIVTNNNILIEKVDIHNIHGNELFVVEIANIVQD